MMETRATEAPCFGELDPLTLRTKPQPGSSSSTRGTFLGTRDAGRPPAPGRKKKGAGRQEGGSTAANWSLDAHPEMAPLGTDEGGPPEVGKEKPQEPTGRRGPEARPHGVKSPTAVDLPPLAPRSPRLPRAGDAHALPVNEAAAPAESGVTVRPRTPPPTAFLPWRPQQGKSTRSLAAAGPMAAFPNSASRRQPPQPPPS